MVVPFGISVGDLIACGKLVQDIFIALRDSKNAGSDYHGLHVGLASLTNSMRIILCAASKVQDPNQPVAGDQLQNIDQAILNGIECEFHWCRTLIESFVCDARNSLLQWPCPAINPSGLPSKTSPGPFAVEIPFKSSKPVCCRTSRHFSSTQTCCNFRHSKVLPPNSRR